MARRSANGHGDTEDGGDIPAAPAQAKRSRRRKEKPLSCRSECWTLEPLVDEFRRHRGRGSNYRREQEVSSGRVIRLQHHYSAETLRRFHSAGSIAPSAT